MAGVRVSVRVRDLGWANLQKEVKKARHRGSYTRVGLLGEKAAAQNDEDLTNAELGAIHEYGAPAAGIPARPFIGGTIELARREYLFALARLMRDVYGGKMSIKKALGVLGAKVSADIKKRVTTDGGIEPPNTPEVFMRKLMKGRRGFNKSGLAPRPLIDTGRLINAVGWDVHIANRKAGEGE